MSIQDIRQQLQGGIDVIGSREYTPVAYEATVKATDSAAILGNLVLVLEDAASLHTGRITAAADSISGALQGSVHEQAERAVYFSGQAATRVEDLTAKAAEILPTVRSLITALNEIQQTGQAIVTNAEEAVDSTRQYIVASYMDHRLKDL